MARTTPNFACQFVYSCRKLPCTYFPSFLLRSPEIKYAKTLACHSPHLLELLLHNTISVVSLLSFFQMLTLTPRVKSSQFYQSQGQGYRSKLGLTLKVWVTEQGQGQDSCQGQGQSSRLKLLLRVSASAQCLGSGLRVDVSLGLGLACLYLIINTIDIF